MKAVNLFRLGLFAASVGLLGSCTPDGGTIYATIEAETKIVDNTLANTATVGDMVGAGGTYYVAVGQLYKGTLAGTVTWTALGTQPTGSLANTLAFDGTTYWAGLVPQTGPASSPLLGLYSTTAPDSTAFAPVTDPKVATKQIYSLSAIADVGSPLYVVCAMLSGGTNYVYELERESGGSWAGSPLVSNQPSPIVGVAWGGTANHYYMASGGTIYSSATGTDSFPTVSQPLASGDTAQGIFGDTVNHRVFVVSSNSATTSSGSLYYETNDGGWTKVTVPQVNSTNVPLLCVAGPIDSGQDKYLVGSDGFGFFTFSVGAGTFTQFSDSTVPLITASIRRILIDGTGPSTVLMGTNILGLWRATFDATGAVAVGAWTHE